MIDDKIILKYDADEGETLTEHFNNLCENILSYHPTVIMTSSRLTPIVIFSDKFVHSDEVFPLTGIYKYGELDGVDVIVDNNMEDYTFYIIPATSKNKPEKPVWFRIE